MKTPTPEESEIALNPLVYVQKPAIGSELTEESTPVQVVFPTGGFSIGLIPRTADQHHPNNTDQTGVGTLISGPLDNEYDRREKLALIVTFNILAIVNIVLTCCMFFYATRVELSLVEPQTGYLPSVYQQISAQRRPIEIINFVFTIILIVIGSLGTFLDSALLISIYSMGIVTNFMLGTTALPYLTYAFRYILDMAMVYFGLVYRSRIMYTILPMHLHRQ